MMIPDQLVVIRPGMMFHWTDGPKWIIDTMNFGYDPEVHGQANCVHVDAASAIDLLKGDSISAVSTIYVYATWDDWVRIRNACPERNLNMLTF